MYSPRQKYKKIKIKMVNILIFDLQSWIKSQPQHSGVKLQFAYRFAQSVLGYICVANNNVIQSYLTSSKMKCDICPVPSNNNVGVHEIYALVCTSTLSESGFSNQALTFDPCFCRVSARQPYQNLLQSPLCKTTTIAAHMVRKK